MKHTEAEEENLKNGCPHRKWGWHDGGPDYKCLKQGANYCCENSLDEHYRCDYIKEVYFK